MAEAVKHPSHEWFEIDEGDRIAEFCEKCNICSCHSASLASKECPGEPTGPEYPTATPEESSHD